MTAITMFGLLLRRKYHVFRVHHDRLRSQPDPDKALARFEYRFKEAVRVNRVRLGAYALAYSGVIFAVTTILLDQLTYVSTIERALKVVSGVTSSLAIVALALILACNRFLALVDVELYFLSLESRMEPGEPSG